MNDYKNIIKEEFEKILLSSNSKSSICRLLKISTNKRGIDKITDLINNFNLNTNHFDKTKWRKRKYERKERACPVCKTIFIVADGSVNNNKKYCSQKCANSIPRNFKHKERDKCIYCNEAEIKKGATKFCSHECYRKHQKEKLFKSIEEGKYFLKSNIGNSKNRYYKIYLIYKFGHKCSVCKNSEWMGKPIPLQVDHKDGDSDNDNLSNLRNICPNCHAQTPTYCNKNKGKGKRKHRMEDYYKGKKKW